MWTEPAVYQYTMGRPATGGEDLEQIAPLLGPLGPARIRLLGGGREGYGRLYLGEMGFADFHRDIDPPLDGQPELGWILKTTAHGKGYATEALTAISSSGDSDFGSQRKRPASSRPGTNHQSALPGRSAFGKSCGHSTRAARSSCSPVHPAPSAAISPGTRQPAVPACRPRPGQPFMLPVPPGKPDDPRTDLRRKSPLEETRGNAPNDGVGNTSLSPRHPRPPPRHGRSSHRAG